MAASTSAAPLAGLAPARNIVRAWWLRCMVPFDSLSGQTLSGIVDPGNTLTRTRVPRRVGGGKLNSSSTLPLSRSPSRSLSRLRRRMRPASAASNALQRLDDVPAEVVIVILQSFFQRRQGFVSLGADLLEHVRGPDPDLVALSR